MASTQGSLFDSEESPAQTERSGSFVANMQLPVHRWFRYSAGFSAEWAGELIRGLRGKRPLRVLDPFAGSGTVVLEAERAGAEGIGLEAHPFVARVARAKLAWREDSKAFRRHALQVARQARATPGTADGYPPLILKCFPPETLQTLDALKRAWVTADDRSTFSELCWLALVATLRAASPVGTAQWQYVLPRKAKANPVEPLDGFKRRVELMAFDMETFQEKLAGPPGQIRAGDARQCAGVPDGWADLVVTSPPYANNYDYADATRLEMSFWGEVRGWGDLQNAVRKHLVRSCTQHIASEIGRTAEVFRAPSVAPIAPELQAVCARLEEARAGHGGKKPYHTMIAHYFLDLAHVWGALRRVTAPGGRVFFVIGDSAPYGVHVPVDRWLGELAVAAGFRSYRFEKLRDRNTKWKNRKHRVLLHEGLLWAEG